MNKKRLKTAIVCRTNSPLVKCLFDLIKRRVKARLVGRDVAKSLKDTIGEVLDYRRNCPIAEFIILLDSWIDNIREKFKDKEGHENFVSESEDLHACLKVMSEQANDAKSLYNVVDTYIIDEDSFDEKLAETTIVLCSGHRAKGLEWDRVVVLRDDLMPHPNAETEQEIRQEEHIKYVAYTRPMEQLWVCSDKRPD
jgi:superfamily I DNA/RNA helicase